MRRSRLAFAAFGALLLARAPRAHADGVPKIRSVAPTSAVRGATADVSVEGTNLFPVDDVSTSVPDVTVVVLAGSNDHKLLLRLTIPDTAAPGALTIHVKTKYGSATTDRFAVRARVPVVAKVKPDAVRRGGTYEVTITGALLAFPGFETKVSAEAPMTAVRLDKSTDKALLVRLTVPPATPPGPHSISIETTDGKVAAPFHVLLSPPVLGRANPATLPRGRTTEVTLDGESLDATSGVVLAAPDAAVRLSLSGPATPKAVRLKVDVAPDAVPGSRLVVLSTPDGLATASFDVVVPAPKTLVLAPPGIVRGSTVEVEAKGEGLSDDADLRFVPADPALRIERVAGGRWRVTASAEATMGPRTVVAATKQGAVVARFHVGVRTPVVSGVTPAEVAPGAAATLAFEGQELAGAVPRLLAPAFGVEGTPSGAGLAVRVAADARPGPRDVLLSTPDGSAVGRFAVAGSAATAPAIASVKPGRVHRGRATTVVVSGINLRAGTKAPDAVLVDATGASTALKVVDSDGATATLEVAPPQGGALGGYAIVLSTPDGSAAIALQVDPARPWIASATPASSPRPATFDVTLVGENLAGASPPSVRLVSLAGAAAIPATVASSAPDRVVAHVALDPTAAPVPWLLVLENGDGGAAVPFTVEPRPPSVAKVTPSRVGTPVVTDLVVTGTHLVEPDGKPPRVQVSRLGSASTALASVVSATDDTVVVHLTVAPDSAPGPHVVLVKTADGTAGGVFEVTSAKPPRVVSIEPSAAPRGQTFHAIVRGSGLAGATEVVFSGSGVTAVVLPGGGDDAVPIRVSVAADAEPGPRTFTVEAPGGMAADPSQTVTVR